MNFFSHYKNRVCYKQTIVKEILKSVLQAYKKRCYSEDSKLHTHKKKIEKDNSKYMDKSKQNSDTWNKYNV